MIFIVLGVMEEGIEMVGELENVAELDKIEALVDPQEVITLQLSFAYLG